MTLGFLTTLFAASRTDCVAITRCFLVSKLLAVVTTEEIRDKRLNRYFLIGGLDEARSSRITKGKYDCTCRLKHTIFL
jgi:hypothetical protein